MADPISIATIGAAAGAANKVMALLPSEQSQPFFGSQGQPDAERRCKAIVVFVKCVGRTGTERFRHHFNPTMSPLQVVALYAHERGRPVTQDSILDEHGFELSNQLRGEGLYNLSSGCRLNLTLAHRRNVVNEGVNSSFSAVTEATGAVSGAVSTATGTLASATRKLFGGGPDPPERNAGSSGMA